MRDPHVARLRYALKTDGTLEYSAPPPVERETDHFRLRLADGEVSVEMKEHHATEETARERVGDFLRVWQVAECLKEGRLALRFVFVDCEVIDRDPPPASPSDLASAHLTSTAVVTFSVTGCVLRPRYPEPPVGLSASTDVLRMWRRYELFLEGKEPLLSVAYACLSLVEGSTGRKGNQGARDAAASRYSVEREVLKTLGEISSPKGGPEEARKFDVGATHVPLSEPERTWVQAALRALIQRKAEYDYDPTRPLPLLTMASLPSL